MKDDTLKSLIYRFLSWTSTKSMVTNQSPNLKGRLEMTSASSLSATLRTTRSSKVCLAYYWLARLFVNASIIPEARTNNFFEFICSLPFNLTYLNKNRVTPRSLFFPPTLKREGRVPRDLFCRKQRINYFLHRINILFSPFFTFPYFSPDLYTPLTAREPRGPCLSLFCSPIFANCNFPLTFFDLS